MIRRALTGLILPPLLATAAPAHADCPAVLPLLTFRYRQANLVMTYIPALGGGINHGSTLFAFGRYTLDSRYNR